MSHDTRQISDTDLIRDLHAQLNCTREGVAELQRGEDLPWRHEVAVLGHMLGAISSMAEVLTRTRPAPPEPVIQQYIPDEE